MYDYKERKIVAVLASDRETGVALNVLGHLSIALGAHAPDGLMGRPLLVDASGLGHRGIAKYPFIITKEKSHRIRTLLAAARTIPDLFVVDYPEIMLRTGHDDELAEQLGLQNENSIQYLGIILYGPTEKVNTLTSKLSLWR
jgi:hypothetical protein